MASFALTAMVIEHQFQLLVVVREEMKGFHARADASRIAHLLKKCFNTPCLRTMTQPHLAAQCVRRKLVHGPPADAGLAAQVDGDTQQQTECGAHLLGREETLLSGGSRS